MAFDAVARSGSVTLAAQELDLTQGAVSRQIKKLEAFLEYPLFTREKMRLSLTPVGATYANAVHEGLARIATATTDLRGNPHGGVLNLAILPAFGAHWLAPRLSGFLGAHKGVTLNLSTRLAPFDFGRTNFHAAIHFGRDDWAGAHSVKLMEEELAPVMSEHLARGRKVTVDMIPGLPLLHLDTRPKAWQRWCAQNGIEAPPRAGMVFDQFATMLQAAAGGLGVALVPRFLLEDPAQRRGLVVLDQARQISNGAYYLVWPETKVLYPPLAAFRTWVQAQISQL
ncbi:LysR family transcriptional regulator [Cognatishimia sp. SS12]|uniref:LysR family transcriptional regulator n=1 Tax=Cognatishimia sp. SS12 TaxID=2979465 RepID=UPI00232EA5B9|nr:LysR family transcriptional regulator [Cognatishimia sp. SS12]MDC0737636.1 LysR family transcriptional regulator [Cognatishimia sp. SS12]